MRLRTPAFLALAAAAAFASAQPVSYSRISREIKAGTLLVTGQRVSGNLYNPAPHAWYAMDQEQGIKPATWTFVNPLGQTTLTATQIVRWGLGSPFAAGQTLTKRDAAYWEVDLSNTSDSALSQFDILLLPVRQGVALTAIEREKIRRYVDQGGTLWVDLFPGSAMDLVNGLPVPFEVLNGSADLQANTSHALLTTPNTLTLDDLVQMRRGVFTVTRPIDSAPAPVRILSTVRPDSFRWEGVSGNGTGFAVASARLGDGFLVSTSFALSSLIGRGISGSSVNANEGFRSLPIFTDAFYTAGAKLVANIAAIGGAHLMPGGGSRKSGGIKGEVPAPLLQRFRVVNGSFNRSSQAAHFNGMIIVAQGNNVSAFDANPGRDLNQDGNPDDGVVNPSGESFDLLWNVETDGTASSPVVAEVANTALPSASNQAPNQVWVTTTQGTVYVINADNGVILQTIAAPANVDPSAGPFAPTIHEGMVAVVEAVSSGFGRLRMIDLATATPLATGSNRFSLQGTSRLDIPTASPTLGYIPILDNSGGLDRVAYVAAKGSSGGASLTSVWIGARGESPSRIQRSGSNVILSTRASLQGLPVWNPPAPSSFGIKVTLLEPNTGRPLNASEINAQLEDSVSVSGTPGDVTLTLSSTARSDWDWDGTATPSDTTDDVGWRIDYTIDWTRSQTSNPSADSYIRGHLILPDNSSNQRVIVGSPTLTSRGHVVVAHSNANVTRTGPNVDEGGTSIYNFREEGRGDFVLVSRFDLFDPVRMTYNQTSTVNIRETIIDEDRLLDQLPGFLRVPVSDLRAVAAPAAYGDTIYVAATGYKNIGFAQVPTTVLVALEAHPDPVQFYARGLSEDASSTYSLVQSDPVRSTASNRTTPESVSSIPRSLFTIEATAEAGLSKVTVPSLMSVRRGQIRDSISTSLPVILRRSQDGTDVVIEPEATTGAGALLGGQAAGRYSPLRWYYVAQGYNAYAGPVFAGRTMYFGGSSVLPSLLVAGIPGIRENGLLYGLDTEVSPTDPFLLANSQRAWMVQMSTLLPNSGTPWDVRAANAIRWPQPQGIQSFDDFRVRLLQNALPETRVLSLSAGDGSLAVFSQGSAGEALTVYTQADFSVADAQRVARFDSAGNPLWVLQSTTQLGSEAPNSIASKANTLVEPSRIYPEGQDNTWIVDTGANRVLLVDRAGREQRVITRFRLHPRRVLPETAAGVNQELQSPRDVNTYTRVYTAGEVAALFPGEVQEGTPGPELWRHILLAESGSRRAVELVDRFRLNAQGRVVGVVRYQDSDGAYVPAYSVLFWHSPQELSGGQYGYNSISRLTDPANPNNRITAIGFSSVQPGRSTVGLDTPAGQASGATGFGGVVLYDESRGDTLLLTQFTAPAIPAGAFLGSLTSGRYYFDSGARSQEIRRISGLTSVTLDRRIIGGVNRITVMISEASGVYELIQSNPTGATSEERSQWEVNWMLPREAYLAMRRTTTVNPSAGYTPGDLSGNAAGFRPMHARRLDSGEVLIVNGYTGSTFGPSPRDFNGEVILVEGRFGDADIPGYLLSRPNLGFNSLSIRYELPPVAGIRDLIRPVFAERR